MMRHQSARASTDQGGSALMLALLLSLTAAAVAVGMLARQGGLADTLIRARTQAQAQWILRGALDWARLILQLDQARNATTRLDGVWAQPIAALSVQDFGMDMDDYAPAAVLSGRMEDEQGKYNLRNLIAQGDVLAQEVAALQALLQALALPPALADHLAQRLRAAESTEDAPARQTGVSCLDDLGDVPEMTPARLALLRPYLTVLPVTTPVNLNTASAEALSVVLPHVSLPDLRAVLDERDRGLWFTQSPDFFNRLGARGTTPGARVSTRSDWFLVTAQVSIRNTTARAQALLDRRGGQAPRIRWVRTP